MSQGLKIGIGILVAGVFGAIVLLIMRNAGGDRNKAIEKIPPFKLQGIDGRAITGKDIPSGVPSIFIYFKSDCDHCMNEVNELAQNGSQLKGFMVFLVSEEEVDSLRKFSTVSGLNQYPFIHIAQDQDGNWRKAFGAKSTPVIYIYDSRRTLIKRIKGEAKVSELLEIAKSK